MIIVVDEKMLIMMLKPGNEPPLKEFLYYQLNLNRMIKSFRGLADKFEVKMVDGVLTGTRKDGV
jgi:hypothetical protein